MLHQESQCLAPRDREEYVEAVKEKNILSRREKRLTDTIKAVDLQAS